LLAVSAIACTGSEPAPVSQAAEDSAWSLFRPNESTEVSPGVRCHRYDRYAVVEWESPDPEPVAIVRRSDQAESGIEDCTRDSLPGDFVVRNEWAEYFYGLWEDVLFLDSGTGQIRSLILYDVPSRAQLLTLDAAGEMDGLVDSTTVKIWMLSGTGSRDLCPDIPAVLDVGIDSLFAFNLRTLEFANLGDWRCHALQ